MDVKEILGIIYIILGLIFIIFPIFSSEAVSIIIGLSLLFFGFTLIINGFSVLGKSDRFSKINLILGIIAVIFGLLFIFAIGALPFLVGLQFYIIGFIMLLFGIIGLISKSRLSKTTSLLILIIGVISFILGFNSMDNPIYAAILVGICLIIQGIRMYMD